MRDKCMDVSHQRDHERQVYGRESSERSCFQRQEYGSDSLVRP